MEDHDDIRYLQGIHFHNSSMIEDVVHLKDTLEKVKKSLGHCYELFNKMNIGGGYLYSDRLFNFINRLAEEEKKEITFEPGYSLVNDTGYLICRVVDSFEKRGEKYLILDGGVNQLPEVFEYQSEADVYNNYGSYRYHLCGPTCLAGDYLGYYGFEEPMVVGSLVVFKNVGAYSLVKQHRFNGIKKAGVICNEKGIDRILKEAK